MAMDEEIFEDSEYTSEEQRTLEADVEKVLIEWRAKVTDADNARQWLNTNLGKRVLVALKTNQMAAMKKCITATDANLIKEAQFDYKVYCQVETIIGSVIMEGQQALSELESRKYFD
jgi:hypothetical protein